MIAKILGLSLLLTFLFVSCQPRSGNNDTAAVAPVPAAKETGELIRGFPGGKLFTNYLLFVPAEYGAAEKQFPLVIFLHNARFRGSDVSKLKSTPFWNAVVGDRNFPFIAVAPLCPSGKYWTDDEANLMAIITEVEKTYRIDRNRVFLPGHSIGGAGTWKLAADYPDRFTAIAPLSSGVELSDDEALALKNMRVWAFHGEDDDIAPFESHSKTIVQVQDRGNERVKVSVLAGMDHMIEDEVYRNRDLFKWFLQ